MSANLGIATQFIYYPEVTGPILEIQSGPTDYPRILEISWTLGLGPSLGAQQTFGLGTPAARGTITNAQKPLQEDTGDSGNESNVIFGTTWSVPPTSPTTYFRRIGYQGATGVNSGYQPIRWRFPNGLMMLPNTSLVIWIVNSGGAGGVLDPSVLAA